MLHRLFMQRMGRALTKQEQEALARHLARPDGRKPAEVQARALSLEGEALAAWLLDSNAK